MTKRPRKIGRPTRKAASAAALRTLVQAGVDPSAIDPRKILASIAADASSPASARVAACRALLAQPGGDGGRTNEASDGADALSRRAIELLAQSSRRPN